MIYLKVIILILRLFLTSKVDYARPIWFLLVFSPIHFMIATTGLLLYIYRMSSKFITTKSKEVHKPQESRVLLYYCI